MRRRKGSTVSWEATGNNQSRLPSIWGAVLWEQTHPLGVVQHTHQWTNYSGRLGAPVSATLACGALPPVTTKRSASIRVNSPPDFSVDPS